MDGIYIFGIIDFVVWNCYVVIGLLLFFEFVFVLYDLNFWIELFV